MPLNSLHIRTNSFYFVCTPSNRIRAHDIFNDCTKPALCYLYCVPFFHSFRMFIFSNLKRCNRKFGREFGYCYLCGFVSHRTVTVTSIFGSCNSVKSKYQTLFFFWNLLYVKFTLRIVSLRFIPFNLLPIYFQFIVFHLEVR